MKLRNAAAAVKNGLVAAGPGRMRLGIDIEGQRIASLAIGRAGHEFGAVGHHHIDGVIVGVNAFLHGINSLVWREKPRLRHYCQVSAALYTGSPNGRQVGQNGRKYDEARTQAGKSLRPLARLTPFLARYKPQIAWP